MYGGHWIMVQVFFGCPRLGDLYMPVVLASAGVGVEEGALGWADSALPV